MVLAVPDLPDDVAALKAMVKAAQAEVAELKAVNTTANERITRLTSIIKMLERGRFGTRSEKLKRDAALADEKRTGMEAAFIFMLLLTSITGLALLLWRETAAMGPVLALHLGVVFALFITLPYGKFVHGLYRYAALVRYARERRMLAE